MPDKIGKIYDEPHIFNIKVIKKILKTRSAKNAGRNCLCSFMMTCLYFFHDLRTGYVVFSEIQVDRLL